MLTKNAGSIYGLSALALTLAGCSSGGEGGAGFHVSTCSLGCTSGEGGAQINCGVVGIAENQEIALLFTTPIDPFSITKESFAVRDAITGASAAGTRLIDPSNPNRLIFRPKLTTGPAGETIFGFETGRSYEVFLNGTVQNDPVPFVLSSDGRENEARVACTVQASQGVVDTIPGKPSVQLEVTVVEAGGGTSQVVLQSNVVPGATEVKTFSSVGFLFDELMDISTLVNPSTGQSPNIDVLLDTDGNIATTNDRAEIEGSYIFGFDQTAQTTSLAFTPSSGFPSLGADPDEPRLVLVVLGSAVSDIAGNGLDLPGTYSFVAQQITYPSVTLPTGGEQFDDQENLDAPISGSPWGTEVAGRLTPGEGGGSGRHGELVVGVGETLVLHSSAAKAGAEITFTALPLNNDEIELGGSTFIFKTTPGANPLHVPLRYSISYQVSSLIDVVRAFADANPTSGVATATYEQSGMAKLRIEAVTPGIPSPAYVLAIDPTGANPPYAEVSSSTLVGGFVAHAYSDPSIVTNFDFSAGTGTPGGTPPDLIVDDGVFEFSRIEIAPTATVLLAGSGPLRLLSRGEFLLSDLATIELGGEDRPIHNSLQPRGQLGGRSGPNGGAGGKGGDRSSQPAVANQSAGGVTMNSPVLLGQNGLGIGGLAGQGEGLGGVSYPAPIDYPVTPSTYLGWAYNGFCSSGMMANTGSGGAYAQDGIRGQTKVVDATGTALAGQVSNKPDANTLGGEFDDTGVEPPSANPTEERLLSPGLGYLRGGSGGGGGGAHPGTTTTDILSGQCFASDFTFFPDNSGAGGGGGGGALQIQAGSTLTLTGQVNAGGGDGGDADIAATTGGTIAAPGGGGSGGAVLIQGGSVAIAQQPSRILVNGGTGGDGGYILNASIAGAGSAGIVRVEQRGAALDAATVAASVFPIDPLDPTSVKWFSSGEWLHDTAKADAFDSVSGSQSCWMEVTGSHFSLTFLDDPAAPALPANMGWNMDVILDDGLGGEVTVPWRGSDGNGHFLGMYPEEHWGTLLNRDLGVGESAAPIVVRFQGAAAAETLLTPCDVDIQDPDGPLVVGSVTAWVRHPDELNDFLPLVTVVRFLVLFDRSHPDFAMIKGVTNLRIQAQPE